MTAPEPAGRPEAGSSPHPMIGLFVDRPVASTMVALAIVVVGVLAMFRLPLRLAPEGLSSDEINLFVPIRGDMPPREVERQVVEPLEELLRTIPGVQELDSRASSGGARCTVTLENGMDPVLASAEIRDRVQRARLEWPSDVDRYFTWREDASSAPLAFFQIQTPARDPSWDYKLDAVIRPRLEAVDGVGRVEIWGLVDETLRIWFDRDKLIEHRIDYGQLLSALSRDNFAQPVGELDDGRTRYLVRVDAKFRDRSEIESYPIRAGLVIGDIARVEAVPSVRDQLSRFDRKFTYTAMLRLASGTNPVEASQNIRVAMDQMQLDPDLGGIGFRFLFDQGAMIEDSLNTLLSTSLQGGALALIVLFLFLWNLRVTFAVAIAIPMSLMIATGYMFFAGHTLNILTMAGMTLAVGMVVDNAVVVLENIRHRKAMGDSLREACIRGTGEMRLAIVMSTLTTIVVILPMIFMGNDTNVRESFAALGMPLAAALLGSLFVAILLLPAATRQLGCGNVRAEQGGSRFSPIASMERLVTATQHIALRNPILRLASLVVLIACIATMAIPMRLLEMGSGGGGGGGPFRGGDVRIALDLPRGMTLSDVAELVEDYEDFLFERAVEFDIDHIAVRFDRNSARFDLMLKEDIPRDQHRAYRQRVVAVWPRRPGVNLTLTDRDANQGGGSASEEEESRNFVLRLWGPDSEYLSAMALTVRDRLAAFPEVASVELSEADGNEQVVVEVNRDRLSDLGVQPEALQRTMSSGLRGLELTRFEEDDREIRLISQFDAEREPTLLDLKETQVYGQLGTFQRVDDLTRIRFERTLETISRRNGKTNVTVVGERAEKVASREMSEILRNVMESTTLPRGYSWTEESQRQEFQEQLRELGFAGMLGIVLIFILMAIFFESLVLPLAILLFPALIALFGATWSLYLFFGGLDVMAVIGIILLCGVVVNNGIVLLDCIERLRHDGIGRRQAIVEGTRLRLRPIVMTAATTIFGLLPMAAFGEATENGLSYQGMSIAVAGGLAASTIFTPLMVPLAYAMFDDLDQWIRSSIRRAVVGGGALRRLRTRPS